MAAAAPVLPPDYHRIISPTLRIPTDPAVTIPVGLLACQRDPLLRSLDSTVVSTLFLKPSLASSQPNRKAHTKQAKASAPPVLSQPYLQLVLHDTLLFPEGGGQAHDIGVLTTEDRDIWQVRLVKRHGGVAVHYIVPKDGSEDVPVVLSPGKKVRLELGEEGFKRRLDHMSVHTAQHLVSALIETRLSLPTLAWSLTSYPSPSYVDLPRALTPAESTLIQDEANRLVFEGRRVHIEVQELPSGQQGVDSGSANGPREFGRGLPEDYTGGVHRVVVIDGVDRNPCCGTHLPTLSSLQTFLLPPPTTSTSGPVRHYFLSGPRLLAHLGSVQTLLTRTAGALSCGITEAPDRVALVVDESKRREKRIDDIERELANALGKSLVEEMIQWQKSGGQGEWTKYIGRTDDSPTALAFLQAITFAFLANLSADLPSRYTLLLTSSPSSQTPSSITVIVVFGSEDKRVKEVGEEMKRQFKTLKGGGRGTRWSGKSTGVWLAEREGKMAAAVLSPPSA